MKKGLETSKKFFEDYGASMLHNQFREYEKYIAVGLAGEGSECLGFDDEFSMDHDFDMGFCVWLPYEIYRQVYAPMQEAYDRLPITHIGIRTKDAGQRHGIQSIEGFYKNLLGIESAPTTNMQWLSLPEEHLAVATSGKVFLDNYGEFSKIRKALCDFYPNDVMLKKLAARLFYMGQAGQYNYARCVKRKDAAAAYLCKAKFIELSVSALHLMSKKYKPFYKWSFRSLEGITKYAGITGKLKMLCEASNAVLAAKQNEDLMQEISVDFVRELQNLGFTASNTDFLVDQAAEVCKKIIDPDFRTKLPVPFDLHL